MPFRTPFPTSYLTNPLPFCLCAICPSLYTSFVMGVVSAEREVPRFAGMGAVQKSPSRRAVVLMSYTQKIQWGSTMTPLQYTRDSVT